ncbi:MAG: NAD(P)-binding protein [Chitinophagaceae bacterium]|nr:NAD(P)-binding protein [Chitinophagaceae bacterium]
MSGHHTCTDGSEDHSRRSFVKKLLGIAVLPALIPANSCKTTPKKITGNIAGANHTTGHLLRNIASLPEVSETLQTNILIAGGGIAGLSAKRMLHQHNVPDVMMVEMDKDTGGNSTFGKNEYSAYPWGAHYLPIPEPCNTELTDFLHSAGVITGFNNEGLPVYNEYHLCHSPEERLYINGYWQPGIVPEYGIGDIDRKQISDFFKLVNNLKNEKGDDGLHAFSIPVDRSSKDIKFTQLDNISFAQYLAQKGFTSEYLLWYLEYCCKDDYGCRLNDTSAWAGLHYFASRRGAADNAESSAVLTWPEGNGFLMKALRAQCGGNIHTNMLVYSVHTHTEGAEVLCYDVTRKKSVRIIANKLLLSTPQFVNKHLLGEAGDRLPVYDIVSYSPWMIANITFRNLPQAKGETLCWDNVMYGQPSVGYVYANHQDLRMKEKGVITYYLPIAEQPPKTARNNAYSKSYEYWQELVLKELNYAHPGVADYVDHMDIWLWGHGMIRPVKGYIWGYARQKAMRNINDSIFFAHSDLSGISIFEEAFYQGIRAAKEMTST